LLSAESFWSYSVALYARPEFSDTCLALQDEHGFDVNLLLLCLWLARHRLGLSAATIAGLSDALHPWTQAATAPLRGLRRRLKGMRVEHLGSEDVEQCRIKIKAAELESERIAQKLLVGALANQALFARPSPREAAAASLDAYVRYLDAAPAAPLVGRLLESMPDA